MYKKAKQKKSTEPDTIPNEAIIEADPETREIYLKVMNQIYQEKTIPRVAGRGNN